MTLSFLDAKNNTPLVSELKMPLAHTSPLTPSQLSLEVGRADPVSSLPVSLGDEVPVLVAEHEEAASSPQLSLGHWRPLSKGVSPRAKWLLLP